MVGFGAMGQAALPLLLRHFELDPSAVKIVKTREDESGVATEYGVEVIVAKLEEGNHAAVLEPLLVKGAFC